MKCFSLKNDGDKKITANFRVREFKCQDGSDPIFISLELVELLQKVRTHFGKSVVITSGYRTVKHNKEVGGSNYDVLDFGNGNCIDIDVTNGYYQGYGAFEDIYDRSYFEEITYNGGGTIAVYNKNYILLEYV